MTTHGEHSDNNFRESPRNSSPSTPRHHKITDSIAVYTKLSILIKMRQELGLEAMLEYLDMYVNSIEANNPELKRAVTKALTLISVRQIYSQAFPK